MTIFATPANPWAPATINSRATIPYQPRLLATAPRISRLQNRWANPTTAIASTGKTWASLQTAWAASTGNAASAIPWAMKYLATGSATDATNAYNACSTETYTPGSGITAHPENMRINCSGVVLDWCYPALTSGQKTTLIANCQSFVNSARGALQAAGGFDLVGPANNCVIQNYVFNALAAEGEAGFTSELANVRVAVQNMLNLLDESWADGAWRAYEYVLIYNWLTLDAYFTATSDGEALLASRSQHVQSHGIMAARQLAWDSKSFTANGIYGGYRAATGQTDAGNADDTDDPWQTAVFSDINRDPVTKWLADTVLTNMTTPQQGYTCTPPWSHQSSLLSNPTWLAFLYYDDTLTGIDPGTAGVATCAATMPSGTFNFRGSWNIGAALVGNYIAGPFRQNDHDGINIGCLTLRVGSTWLITDASAYAGSPSNYGPGTFGGGVGNGAAGFSEVFGYTTRSSGPTYTPTATQSTREDRDGSGYNQSNSLPPGQGGTYPLAGVLTDNARKTYDVAAITAFVDDGTTAVCTSDLSKGFPQMTSAKALVAYKRGAFQDLGTIAIWDQCVAPSTVGHERRNFHSLATPLSLDGTITVHSGSLSAGVLTASGTTTYFETGGYRCTFQCPSQLQAIDIIGGSGFEGWLDGYGTAGGSPLSNGANLTYIGNTQLTGQRVTNSGNWIETSNHQWRTSFLHTQGTNSNNEMMYVVTVTPAGTPAPVLTLGQAKALFTVTPPSPPASLPVEVGLSFDNSVGRLLYGLIGANMNTTADQKLVPVSNPTLSAITGIIVTNASTSLTTAVGGFYSGATKTGLNLVANTQVYSALTSSSKLLATTLGSDATSNVITSAPYFSLTTPQGGPATADIYLVGSDLNAVDAAIPTPPPNPNAAQFITSSITSVSSLDTGRIGYIVAWGGTEFNYAYTYAISGAPAGVTIDGDMGLLSLASPVAAGNHTFTVTVTNRENTSNFNTFSYTLTVLAGITSGTPTSGQVLHKTYDPDGGVYGNPSGTDYTAVLLAIQTAIQSDQASAGEEQLRATIPFQRGKTYNYTNNHWLTGLQYYDCVATGAGANPILQNNGSGTVYEGGPLNIGKGGAINNATIKGTSALIQSVAAGATSITLQTPSQVSRLAVGRWHGIVGGCIQLGGFPPNVMFMDYVRVLSVNSGTGVVTLDRPLKFAYSSTWWENFSDDTSLGRGWILPWDTGGSAGPIPSDPRLTLRGRYYNINFVSNPSGDHIILVQMHIQCDFDGCNLTNPQLTMTKHFGLFNSTTVFFSEPDKVSETLFYDTVTSDGLGGVTGFQYFLARNSNFTTNSTPIVQISPRQFRSIGTTYNSQSSGFPPFTFSYNGPNWYVNFKSSIFTSAVNTGWTFTGNPFSPLTIGSDAVWSGSQLQVQRGSSHFQDWLINSYPGGIVAVNGLGPITANWGYISSVTSDGLNNGNLWLNIVWVNGTQPSSGTIDIVAARFRRLNMESTCSFTGSTTYTSGKFAKQTTTPFAANYDFPVGLPPPYNE